MNLPEIDTWESLRIQVSSYLGDLEQTIQWVRDKPVIWDEAVQRDPIFYTTADDTANRSQPTLQSKSGEHVTQLGHN